METTHSSIVHQTCSEALLCWTMSPGPGTVPTKLKLRLLEGLCFVAALLEG
jgi:hypothetical protein